jgi:SsrA-binding protein
MKIYNKKINYDYSIQNRIEAGINLYGHEVKSIKSGHADLTGSFVKIQGNEAYLVNAKVFPYKFSNPLNYDQVRTRKLLLHKKEILALKSKTEGSNLTIVPISMYVNKNGLIKVELGIAKGKKKYEKKELIKKRDLQRQIEQELRGKI